MSQRYNRPNEAGVLQYVTLNVRQRRKAFARDEFAKVVLEELDEHCSRHPGKLMAYIVLSDHVHFMLWLNDGKLSEFLSKYKPAITKRVDAKAAELGNQRIRHWLVKDGARELWQDGKHAVALWSRRLIRQKIRYIHENPVRAGLAENPQDYPWSSIGAYDPELGIIPPVPVDLTWK